MDYKDIAPYTDQEVPAAVKALIEELSFIKVLRFVYPDLEDKAIYALCQDIRSVSDFQAQVAYPAMKLMNAKTITALTHSGIETLKRDEGVLFISNHRDIILDSAILNMLLHEHKMDTTETAIGSNLLKNPTVRHLTKLNRNFTVNRDVPRSELYENSLKLSTYIRDAINVRNTSVWISQREGRAKDGNDRTQQGLLKMLAMSGPKDVVESFSGLKIRPLALSYEYDPCDVYKLRELVIKARGEKYEKEAEEDLANIVAGISMPKGRVHLALRPSINAHLKGIDTSTPINEQVKQVADLIDREIHAGAKLWPNNYRAQDLLNESTEQREYYSEGEASDFEQYMNQVIAQLPTEMQPEARPLFLKKYAYPLINQQSLLIDTE